MATSLVRFGGWVGFASGLKTPSSRTPRISKILHAYDVMLICKAKVAEIRSVWVVRLRSRFGRFFLSPACYALFIGHEHC